MEYKFCMHCVDDLNKLSPKYNNRSQRAWEQEHFKGVENNSPPTFATDFLSVADTTRTFTGWVAGAGAETMMTDHILVRVEYLYYGFNSGTTAQANLLPNPGAFPAPFTYNWASQNVQVVRAGFSYKF